MSLKIDNLQKEIKEIKEKYPLFTPFCEIEYQLDRGNAVILLSYPFENGIGADYSAERVGEIDVSQVYTVAKAIDNEIDVIISDTTYGDFYHEDTLENTLKELSHLFYSNYCGGREWLTAKPEVKKTVSEIGLDTVAQEKFATVKQAIIDNHKAHIEYYKENVDQLADLMCENVGDYLQFNGFYYDVKGNVGINYLSTNGELKTFIIENEKENN